MSENVIIDGTEYERRVSLRCKNIGRHNHNPVSFPGCACHPTIPQPCPDCYAVESLSRRVPWTALGTTPQPDATGSGEVLP